MWIKSHAFLDWYRMTWKWKQKYLIMLIRTTVFGEYDNLYVCDLCRRYIDKGYTCGICGWDSCEGCHDEIIKQKSSLNEKFLCKSCGQEGYFKG